DDKPFFWSAEEGFVSLALPPWLTSAFPAEINDGDIVVGRGIAPGLGDRGFVFEKATGIWTMLPPQNLNGWSAATGINSSGAVSGWRSIDDGGDPVYPLTAFYWTAKRGFADLGLMNGDGTAAMDINDAGNLCGSFVVDGEKHAPLW